MKKNIPSYEALLILHASKGDSTAFHSLIVSHLKIHYLRMVEGGIEHSDASAKLCTIASGLFKKFIGAQPEDFDSWLKANGEIENIEHDYSPSNNAQIGQNCFVNELQLCLLRTGGALHQKCRIKKGFINYNTLPGKTGAIGLVLSVVLISLLTVFVISNYTLKVPLVSLEKKERNFVLPFIKQAAVVIPEKKVDSIRDIKSFVKIDSISKDSVKADTIVKKTRSKQMRKTLYSNGIESQDSIVHEANKYNNASGHSFESPKTEVSVTPIHDNLIDSSGNVKPHQQPALSPGDSNIEKF